MIIGLVAVLVMGLAFLAFSQMYQFDGNSSLENYIANLKTEKE